MRSAVTQAGGNLTIVAGGARAAGPAGDRQRSRRHPLCGPRRATPRSSSASANSPAASSSAAVQLVDRELLSRVRGVLLSAFDGQLGRLEGLVVMRAEPTGMTPEQSAASTAFDTGLLNGIAAVGVPTVGVELTNTEPSQVPWYESKNLSSVDDLDEPSGQAALSMRSPGHTARSGSSRRPIRCCRALCHSGTPRPRASLASRHARPTVPVRPRAGGDPRQADPACAAYWRARAAQLSRAIASAAVRCAHASWPPCSRSCRSR